MRYSYSFVNLYQQCPMKWYIRYRVKPEIEEDLRPHNPLNLGILLEDIVKDGLDKAKKIYYNKYPIIQDNHINEVIKAEYFANQIKDKIVNPVFEYKLETVDFIGYIDCLELNSDGSYTLTDFKYSNYKDNYINSMQLHLYKYYFEKITGNKVSNLQYIIAPKLFPRKGFDESIQEFRRRLNKELNEREIKVYTIEYDKMKVQQFFNQIEEIKESTTIDRNIGNQCGYCEYTHFCLKER